jgi:uncharacterized protein YndB with AHSA1/START domain
MAASTKSIDSSASTVDREILLTRVFEARQELVYEAWTNPEHLVNWYGPNGFRTTVHEMDVRPGGQWRLTMRGPDGRDYKNRIVFLEVDAPRRLVYKHEPEEGSEPVSFISTVTFVKRGERTELTMQMIFPTAEVRNYVAEHYGAVEGGKQTLGRLAEHLAKLTGRPDAKPEPLVIVREFDAAREIVFKLWTNAEHLRRWWGPKGFTNPRCEFDARQSGAIRIDMRGPDGTVYPMSGEVREVVPPEKLVFMSAALGADGKPLFEILNTVLFEEKNGKTKLTLTAEVLNAGAEAPKYLAGMSAGWNQSLDRLAEAVRAEMG